MSLMRETKAQSTADTFEKVTSKIALERWSDVSLSLSRKLVGGLRVEIALGGGAAPELSHDLTAPKLLVQWMSFLGEGERRRVGQILSRLAGEVGSGEGAVDGVCMDRFLAQVRGRKESRLMGSSVECVIRHGGGDSERCFSGACDLGSQEQRLSNTLATIAAELPHALSYRDDGDAANGILAEVARAAAEFRMVARMFRAGHPLRSIAASTGISERLARSWMMEDHLPLPVAEAARIANVVATNSHAILRIQSEQFAKLLGMFLGCIEMEAIPNQIRLTAVKRVVLKAAQQCIFDISGERPSIERISINNVPLFQIRYFNRALLQTISDSTDGFTKVPYAALGTPPERSAFLSGLLEVRGAIQNAKNCNGVRISRASGEPFLVGVAKLLRSFDIHAKLNLTGAVPSIGIFDSVDIERLHGIVDLADKSRQAGLTKLSRRVLLKSPGTAEQYTSALKLQSEGGIPRTIAVALGLPRDTVRAWLSRGAMPVSVLRRKELDEACRLYPQPDLEVVPFLVRTLHASPRLANRLGSFVTLPECQERLAAYAGSMKGNDAVIEKVILGLQLP